MIVVSAGTVMLARPGVGIQFGIIPAQAVILPLPGHVGPGAVLRAFESARTPIEHATLTTRLVRCGVEPVAASNIIEELLRAGTLQHQPTIHPITVLRTGKTAEKLSEQLQRRHIAARMLDRPLGTRGEVTILTNALFPTTDLHLKLMEQRAIHLPAGILDGKITIGPLIYPGHSVCFTCIDAHYETKDAAWKSIRIQATAKPDGGDTPGSAELSHTVASLIEAHLVPWIEAGNPPHQIPELLSHRITVDPLEGITHKQHFPHSPGCPGCALAALAQA